MKTLWHRYRRRILFVAVLTASVGLFLLAGTGTSSRNVASADIKSGELAVYAVYDGKLESRNVVTIMSRYQGQATVIELTPEGSRVKAGDVLVRFDSTKLEWDLVKLEKERALDKSELESLVSATLPMELQEIEHDLVESRGLLEAERQYLNDSITLSKENLISRQEVDKQRMKVKGLESKADQIAQRLHLTKTHLHPAKLERARAKLNSDELSLEIARKQLESSIVRAPADGIVVYKPLSVGGEFRTVRVGDTVFPNQPFMVLPDMQDLVVHCDVPESELARVEPGAKALVRALAYPDKTYNGQVTSISSVAQTLPGYPAWQKFFHVTIGLESADARIRPGMSVTAHVLSFYRKDATLIPRRAVSWEGNRAVSRVLVGGDYQPREISVGAANDMYYEVLAGVALGDKVALQ